MSSAPAIHFAFEGDTAVRPRRATHRATILTAEGRVAAVDDGRLRLTEGSEVALAFALPDVVDLSRMVGMRARLTLREEPIAGGHAAQSLTLADADGCARMIASYGPARVSEHLLGDLHVRVAQSQRSGGPLVFGTEQLQCLVHVGEHVLVSDARGAWIMHVVARSATGYAAYLVADRALWRGR